MKHLTPQEIDGAPVGTVIITDKGGLTTWEVTGVWLPSDDFEAWAEDRAREYNELAADRFA